MSQNIQKQEMQNYLLGGLDEERRTQWEQRILSDPDLYEELLLNEEELIDQYLAGSLSELERQQFETNFLITPKRQKSLQFGRLLKRYLNAHPVVPIEHAPVAVHHHEKTAPAKKSFSFDFTPTASRTALAFSLSVIVFAGILFVAWFAGRKPIQHPAQTSSSMAAVPLAPGSTRSAAGTFVRVQMPVEGSDVKLELELTNTSFQNYRSELLRENRPLKTIDKLKIESKGEQHIVPLTIPGELLSPGDYQVRLSGVLDTGANEFIDNYSFRVIE